SKGLRKAIMTNIVESKPFVTSDRCAEIIRELTQLYSDVWEDSDFHKGKVALLSSISYGRWSRGSFFLVGVKVGFIVGLLSWLGSIGHDVRLPQNCVYVYRCIAAFIIWIWLWGLDIYIWVSFASLSLSLSLCFLLILVLSLDCVGFICLKTRQTRHRLNYVFIFEFDPRTRMTYYQIFDEAAKFFFFFVGSFYLLCFGLLDCDFLTIVYLVNLLAFMQCLRYELTTIATVLPSSLLILTVVKLILPWFSYKPTRLCLLTSLYQTIIAPFGRVRFRDFYLGGLFCIYIYTCSVWWSFFFSFVRIGEVLHPTVLCAVSVTKMY
ncbi:hypothetical protein RFI_15309, partial [Reticulomyxa filosa]